MTDLDKTFLDNVTQLWAITQIANTILLTIYNEDGIIKKTFDDKGTEVVL